MEKYMITGSGNKITEWLYVDSINTFTALVAGKYENDRGEKGAPDSLVSTHLDIFPDLGSFLIYITEKAIQMNNI